MLNIKSFALLAVGLVGLTSVAAFSALEATNRTVDVTVVADDAASAYLQIANQDARYDSLVSTDVTTGKTSVSVTKLNPSATFYFDGILKVTNQGPMDLCVKVDPAAGNAILTKTAFKSSNTTWANADYKTTSNQQTLAAGSGAGYVGLMFATPSLVGAATAQTLELTATRGACA